MVDTVEDQDELFSAGQEILQSHCQYTDCLAAAIEYSIGFISAIL